MTARDTTLALLASRSPTATICPSEVARALAPGAAWREAMPMVHAAVDALLAEGAVQLSWKGKALRTRAGPYRIGREACGSLVDGSRQGGDACRSAFSKGEKS